MVMKVGSFVTCEANSLGIGKIVNISDRIVEVEYFYAIDRQQTVQIPLVDLSQAFVEKQTRCYVQDESTGLWKMGRVVNRDRDEYEVDFPDTYSTYLNEKALYVRCSKPLEDPINVLQGKGQETAFFFNHRNTFMTCMMEQRSFARGMAGLISSSIELLSHQVEVVRRVLEDPIPRYLLADEVGLGKTIEAGVIARQYLIDHIDQRVLFIVPHFLLEQWQQELEQKCALNQFEDRIQMATMPLSSSFVQQAWGMVIIDEAQDVARLAFSPVSEERDQYCDIRSVCHLSKGLLLLSATPVLTNEQEYLSMLHLLDPDHFKLDQVEEFRERIHKRQEVGRVLVSLREETRPFLLRRSLERLKESFPNDRIVAEWSGYLLDLLESEHEEEERRQWIRRLRIHISETYRLHRRLLRNRRETLKDIMPFGRDVKGRNIHCRIEYDLSEQAETLQRLFEEWRYEAWVSERFYWEQQPMPETSSLFQIFCMLWECLGSDLSFLSEVLKCRMHGETTSLLENEWPVAHTQVLTQTPLFDGEKALLQQMLDTVNTEYEDGDRIELLVEIVKRRLHAAQQKAQHLPKIVIFTNTTTVCERLAICLVDKFGLNTIARYHKRLTDENIEDEMNRFTNDFKCAVLICDRSGEVGRNLQFADHLIHFDLPLSPNRIEQRIGRVDRIGRTKPFDITVLAGPEYEESYQELWKQFVDDALNVFSSSISSLQFLVDATVPKMFRSAFIEGTEGLRNAIREIKEGLQEEKSKIDEQNMLDEMDATDPTTVDFFQQLVQYDRQHIVIREALEPWIVKALRFEPTRAESEHTLTYEPMRNKTLVPLSYLLPLYETMDHPGSYDRQVATHRANVKLFRMGDPFIDKLNEYIHWDDRGRAYAIWRQVPGMDIREGGEWKGFIFHFCIEGDIEEAVELWKQYQPHSFHWKALQRRMDLYFPPMSQTIVVNHEGEIEQNPDILHLLAHPFVKKENGGRDTNLTKERTAVIDQLMSHSYWNYTCQHSRKEAEVQLRKDPTFQQLCRDRSDAAKRMTDRVLTMLQIRSQHSQGQHLLAGDVNLGFEQSLAQAYINGIEVPKVSLDSVGFVVLSGEDLEARMRRNSVGQSSPTA